MTENQEEAGEQKLRDDEWELYEQETKCGIGQFQPQWLQKLANKKSYILVYSLIGLTDSVLASYLSATLSTIEKRFKISSRTSGIIAASFDIGNLGSSLVTPYLGSRGHMTRWVACGTLLSGLSCFMLLLPHLIFGPGQDALALTLEYVDSFGMRNSTVKMSNAALSKLTEEESREHICRSEYLDEEDCSIASYSNIPSIIFVFCFSLLGTNTSMYFTLGIAYLDDNVRKRKTAFLLALTQCIKLLGPTIGFLFASYALRKYVDISLHPIITNEDPRWIGAWWIGWVPIGISYTILSGIIALFPKKLPRAAQRCIAAGETVKTNTTRSFSDLKMILKRLTKNKVFLFNSFSSIFFACGFIGYWTFMPKYIETQFRQSASKSSFITGSMGLVFSGIGVMLSGIVITKFKPRARYLAAWNVFVELLEIIGNFSYAFLNCTTNDLHGFMNSDKSWNLTAECNKNCDCGSALKYSPVCSTDDSSITFYSACHAGCTIVEKINGTKMYGNCSCIGEDGMGWATDGPCPVDCMTPFTVFIVMQCILKLLSASGRAGNTIIQFRCVDPEDKAVSIGFTEALLCALAFVPGPIVFGMLLDSACTVWGQTCGESGNCWLYDGQRLAYLVNFTASGFLFVGTLLDTAVWYHVKDLQMYDKEDEADDKKKRKVKETE